MPRFDRVSRIVNTQKNKKTKNRDMDILQNADGLPPKLKAMLEVWSEDIEQQVLASSSAFTFLTKLDAYNELFEQQDEKQRRRTSACFLHRSKN